MKKIITTILVAVIVIIATVPSFATIMSTSINLSKSSSTKLKYEYDVTTTSTTKSMTVKITIQKLSGSTWVNYADVSKTHSSINISATGSGTVTVDSGYTYRAKYVFTETLTTGGTSSKTVYSNSLSM